MQPGDVVATHADVSALRGLDGRVARARRWPTASARFVEWYRRYYGVA